MGEIIKPKSGLILISPKYKAQERIVTLRDGTRARLSVDDSGTVQHLEENDRLHAHVVPKSVTIQIRKGAQ